MSINLPVMEIVTILFCITFIEWLFRFVILFVIGKVIASLKDKRKESLKEFQENIKGKEEN